MAQRLRVLISAYACEPGKGSEPEVGWQWALQMARFHDVTVLTRANNEPAIARALEALEGTADLPTFVYHDCGNAWLALKRRLHAVKLYYQAWQRSAASLVAALHAAKPFDLMHHVTFAAFRYPTAIWGHGVPTVWGPIGGAESIPLPLLPWRHPVSLIPEALRNMHNLTQLSAPGPLRSRLSASTVVLASTREMQASLARLHRESRLMPTIGLHTKDFPRPSAKTNPKSLDLLYVGNLLALKGVDLALKALKLTHGQARFTVVGDGNYRGELERLSRGLGLTGRVEFAGRVPRQTALATYAQHQVFIFPSLHDTGGYAVIEAMLNELPVICLDCGGPAVAVADGCGIRVPLGTQAQIINGLASAISHYELDRNSLQEHGRNARQQVIGNYDWLRKGEQMNECYAEAVARYR